ncbi:MAG: DUF309 domain-containing protein [Nodosilinea sp.]
MSASDGMEPNLLAAIAQFNQGDYYDCHDQLEALWMTADTVEKPFFQGILQIAVGFYHLGNRNWQGASILLGEGVNRLRPFAPHYHQVDLDLLIDCGWVWLQVLQQTGPAAIATVAEALNQCLSQSHLSQINHGSCLDLRVNGRQFSLPIPQVIAVYE